MEIKILGWESKGLRCPEYKFEFKNKVNLIQMDNGLGKTTLMALIKITLFHQTDLKTLNIKMRSSNNADSLRGYVRPECTEGIFSLKVIFDKKIYTFEITINKNEYDEKKIVTYRTIDTEHGNRQGYRPPQEARAFLTPAFGKNYIFDAEESGDLFDEQSNSAEKTINTLCQFNILDNVSNYAVEYFKANIHKEGSKASSEHVETLNKRIEGFENRLNVVQGAYKVLQENIKSNEKKCSELEASLESKRNSNKEYKKNKDALLKKQNDNNQAINDTVKRIYDCFIDPMSLSEITAKSLVNFKNNLDVQKLPEAVAREFFNEMCQRQKCICDRPMDENAKKSIMQSSKRYLGEDTTAIIGEIKNLIPNNLDDTEFSIDKYNNYLFKLDREKLDIERQIEIINENADDGDDERENLAATVSLLKKDVKKQKRDMEKYEERLDGNAVNSLTNPKTISSIKALENMIVKLQKDYEKQTESVNLRLKSEKIKKIMEKTKQTSKDLIVSEIKSDYQTALNKIFRKDAAIVKKISNYIELVNSEDVGRGGSEGETITASYLFITEVMKRSGVITPFVNDTPTGVTDAKKRKLIGKTLPKVLNQYIAFVQSQEKAHFVNSLREASDNNCSYTTIAINEDENKEFINKFKKKITEKVNSPKGECFVFRGSEEFDFFDKEV